MGPARLAPLACAYLAENANSVTPTTVTAMASCFGQDSTSWATRTESRTVTTMYALEAPTAMETGSRVSPRKYTTQRETVADGAGSGQYADAEAGHKRRDGRQADPMGREKRGVTQCCAADADQGIELQGVEALTNRTLQERSDANQEHVPCLRPPGRSSRVVHCTHGAPSE